MFSIGEHKLYFYEWEFTNAVNERYTVKSLIKAIRVLECFSVENPELGISEISRMLHLQKSSVYNILTTIECCGYVKQNSQSGKYRLGLKVLHLGYIVSHHMGLRDIFQPYMAEIATKTQEACYFAIPDNYEVLYLEAVYPNGQQTRNLLGERAPLYCTGLGKAMLAFMTPTEQEHILSLPMKAYTQFTICDPKVLRLQLAEIRQQGYSVDDMEHEFGIRCISVPIFGADGEVKAAVSVSGPSMRFNSEKIHAYAHILKETMEPLQHCL